MTSRKYLKAITSATVLTVTLLLVSAGCVSPQSATSPTTPELPDAEATPTGVWAGLFQRTPFPYATPLPAPTPTILDGTYTKFELQEGTPVHCLRCPDYAPEGGTWKLSLDKGIFRIYYEVTGWRSLGSYTLSGDQLTLINDPYCPNVVGTYRWEIQEGELILEEIQDECSISLRAMNLTKLPWRSCRPPSSEAAVTDHWPKPPGCE